MKKSTRWLSALLAFVLCVSLCPAEAMALDLGGLEAVGVAAEADAAPAEELVIEEAPGAEEAAGEERREVSAVYLNPRYAGMITEEELLAKLEEQSASTVNTDGAALYASFDEAAAYLRSELSDWSVYISFACSIPESSFDPDNILYDLFDAAVVHTGDPREGDYIDGQYSGWSATCGFGYWDGYWNVEVQYSVSYFTTYEQELAVDAKIAEVVEQLGLKDGLSTYGKIKRIYDYICSTVDYDYPHLDVCSCGWGACGDPVAHSCYAALIKGTAVCQGYAVLFYRLAMEAGLSARYVTGLGNGGAHAWNIAGIGNRYYYLDSTWDAGVSPAYYEWFMKGTNSFPYHTVDAGQVDSYAMSATDYDPSTAVQLTAPSVSISCVASSGKPRLTWAAVSGAAKYEVWRSASKDGTYYKQGTTTGTSYTNTGAVAGKTYYYKVRAVSASGEYSDYSAVKNMTCDYAQPVVSISCTASTGKPKLTWSAVSGATKYEIWRATSSNGTYTKMYTTTNTYYNNTSAVAGKTYYYKVRAIGSSSYATSAFSTVKNMTCDCAQPVVSISCKASTGKPVLSWAAVDGAVKYEVWRSTSKNGTYYKQGTTTGTTYTNTGATANTTYYYKVYAVGSSSYAKSAASTVVNMTCDCAQPVVSITTNSSGKPKLTWSAVSGATKYEIWRATSKNGTYTKIYTTSNTYFNNTTAKSGYTYFYKVRAIGSSSYATSAYSSIVSAKCK